MTDAPLILVADDLVPQRDLLATCLREWGYRVVAVSNGREAITVLQTTAISMVISDVRMPEMDGLELVDAVRACHPSIPILLVTAFPDIRDAVDAVRGGAVDYLGKPVDLDELKDLVAANLGLTPVARTEMPDLPTNVICSDPRMRRLLSDAHMVADSDATVLLSGESGTGKEILTDLIHGWSRRREAPCVKLNCAAIPGDLLESELFGHDKGAFTGASAARDGRWRAADGGTLMLDEIAELPLPLQAKLLRALEDGSFSPLGSDSSVHADVRVVAATNRDLDEEVGQGRFREDLFYRLNVVELMIPPLRDRPADILPLGRMFLGHFLDSRARIGSAAEQVLQAYNWPGNVRELRNVIERATLLAQGGVILPEHLPARLTRTVPQDRREPADFIAPEGLTLAETEKQLILATVARCNGNRTRAAKELGIGRRTLIYKLKAYDQDG